MINIRVGRYIAKKSFIHNLNPLVKLLDIIILIATIATVKSQDATILSIITIICIVALAKINLKEFYLALKPFIFLIIFTLFIQLFFSKEGVFSFNIVDNIANGLIVTAQFFIIIAISTIFTLTTTQIDIAKSIIFFARPLKIFGANISDISISIIIAIRFIPLLFDEAEKIITAQKLRGIWSKGYKNIFKNLSIIFKAESFIIPLFIKVINYAEKISITLRYKTDIEKKLTVDRLSIKDIISLLITIGIAFGIYNI